MGEITTQVIAAVIAAAMLGVCAWVWRRVRVSRYAQRWLSENVAYMRSGFRLQATLDGDHETETARATIGKRSPDPPLGNHISRMGVLESRPFQRRKSFAVDVYAAWVPFCSSHGWSELVISGWSPVTSRVAKVAWAKEWTLRFNEGNLVIAPGWSPIRPPEVVSVAFKQTSKANVLASVPGQPTLLGEE